MWKLFLILCAVIYSRHGFDALAIHNTTENNAADKLIYSDILNFNRRSIYAKWPQLDQNPRKDLNHKDEKLEPAQSKVQWYHKPFPKKEEQSQYLHPGSEFFRNLRRNAESVNQTNESNIEKARDMSMKAKIALIVDVTLHDAEARLNTLQPLKDKYKNDPAFKIGFILIMIKKSRDVMNELFNLALKHREQWQALEQLKIFELIIHTNSDTTTLVQQLMDLHAASMATTMPPVTADYDNINA